MNLDPLSFHDLPRVVAVGAGATLVLDAWLLLLRRLGVPTLDFALLGRWVAHLARGTLRHAAIARAQPVRAERWLGWTAHYAVGIAFAGLLVLACGAEWLHAPTGGAAVLFGVATVAMPFFVMQPAMGQGMAAARTPAPGRNRLRSLANHAVFGLGLYLAALAGTAIAP